MSKLRRLADRIERTAGIHIFRQKSGPHWPEANFERRLFAYLEVDCAFDVGANVGQFASQLRRTGFQGTILSFEPNPAAFEKLNEAAAADPLWHCLPFALGAKQTTERLNVTAVDLFSSILKPGGESDRLFATQNKVDHVEMIAVRALGDEFAGLQKRYGFKRPFLKMDTQGYDLEVLAGAASVLDQFGGALSEASFIPIYEGQPHVTDTIAAFARCGWSMVELFNVHPESWFTPLIECNCYFVRGDLAVPFRDQ